MSEETIFAFNARAEHHFSKKLAAKDHELERAKRALRASRWQVTDERRRAVAALERLEEIREGFRGKGASRAHYIAILALLRVKKELGR